MQPQQEPKMSLSKKHVASFLLASSMALGVAHAAPGEGGMWSHGGHREGGGPMMQLRGLDLTEAQRDQVFQIFHEQAPAFHEQMKQLRAAQSAMRAASETDRFDASRAQAAADAQGKAVSQLAMLRAQTAQRVRAILTPEQRAKLDERHKRRHPQS
jgi:Spy/CpxP family protein refolding chaperone